MLGCSETASGALHAFPTMRTSLRVNINRCVSTGRWAIDPNTFCDLSREYTLANFFFTE